MVRKKIDNRLRVLIENGVKLGHRTMFVVVGDKGRDQVVILHHMLSKATIKARPNVLWCYKKELGFSSHRKKRMKTLQRKIKSGKLNVNEDDPFELFVASTNIRYSYYAETHKILGNTFGMCVLQDFEALTPNLLARTIETVEGGGLVVLLLRSVTSLRQLYTLSMDVHERFRTESQSDVVGRFNERFLLSLASNSRCLVVDDQLTPLPLSSHHLAGAEPLATPTTPTEGEELQGLKEGLRDTQPIGCLVDCCKTADQAKALLKFVEAVSEKTLRATVSLTAARGRGKSAALGLAVASAIAFGYSNIFITSPSPENLNTLFEFLFKGLDALEYQEHLDYDLVQSTNPELNKAVVRVNVFKDHRQTVQYIHPSDSHKLNQAELVVIDEAAAIPLPLVRKLLGGYLVFMASTVSGYEGTGRSLSLKLLKQLREGGTGRQLAEVTLEESIRYKPGDPVERWLGELLCLSPPTMSAGTGCPPPPECDLYYVNRDTLFCYHAASESFLQRLVSLYVSSHYKNTPNDLQMLSDAPAHHLFVLLGPITRGDRLPEVLVVIQVCLEGELSRNSTQEALTRGRRAAGDLIPWTVCQQYQDLEFPSLAGARIVRIATHPDYQGMGYGGRAMHLLKEYYSGRIASIDEASLPADTISTILQDDVGLLNEHIEPRKSLPPLLLKLSERPPESLDYLGVSFGLTESLLRFWKRCQFVPVYLRQTSSDLTGEHSCIMLDSLRQADWLQLFYADFSRRFIALLAYKFREFTPALSLGVLQNKQANQQHTCFSSDQLLSCFTPYDVKRLEMYASNLADFHLIMDLLPTLSRLYFSRQLGDLHFPAVQAAILLGLGLQHKTVEQVSTDLELASSQILGFFNRIVRRFVTCLHSILAPGPIQAPGPLQATALQAPGDLEMDKEEARLKAQQGRELKKLKKESLAQFAIKGSELEWDEALKTGSKNIVTVTSGEKRASDTTELENPGKLKKKKKKHRTL